MSRRALATIITALAFTAGCGSSITSPVPASQARPASGPSADEITGDGTNPDGTCRSGYIMANGRCALI